MTIQSHWTNDNYRDNFERIFGKKNDDAKAEDSTRADGGSAALMRPAIRSASRPGAILRLIPWTARPRP